MIILKKICVEQYRECLEINSCKLVLHQKLSGLSINVRIKENILVEI